MRSLVLALMVPLLAGCLVDDPPAPIVYTSPDVAQVDCTIACNMRATVAPSTRQANELSIAVNPTNPLNIIASGKDYTPLEAGDCVRDGIYVTHDGGATWSNSNVPGSPWHLLASPDTFVPHNDLSKFWCVTDPVVAFAPDGTAYWTIMPYQCDAVSGSKTGGEILPDGGPNDWLWTCSSMYVLVSEDGGDTWPTVREVAFGPRLEHDKQWMAVSPQGKVLLCWDRDPTYQLLGLAPGGNPAEQLNAPGYMVCATSDDRGRTWSDVTDVNPDGIWDGYLPWVDFAADGTAWMAAINSAGEVIVSQSPDGLKWSLPITVGRYTNPPPSGAFGWPALNGSAFRTFTLPALAVDRSAGPYGGTIYVTWMDHSGRNGDVLVTTSTDGLHWSAPMRVHDAFGDGHDQFMPAISVGPDGTADLVWYDTRNDTQRHKFDLYHAYSTNGGKSWSANLRVSTVSIDEQFSHHQNGMIFMGDYNDIDSTDGHAYPVWVDTRHGKADVYIAKIARPGAN